jgi:hypothetical protein
MPTFLPLALSSLAFLRLTNSLPSTLLACEHVLQVTLSSSMKPSKMLAVQAVQGAGFFFKDFQRPVKCIVHVPLFPLFIN